jgi:hypothetical protein
VCAYESVYPALSLLGNGSVNIPLVVRQRLGRNVTAVTNTRAIEELLDASFSMWPVSYQEKWATSSSQNFLFLYNEYLNEIQGNTALEFVARLLFQ